MKSFRVYLLTWLLLLVEVAAMSQVHHSPEWLAQWRDSIELTYRRDPKLVDVAPMAQQIMLEPDQATAAVMHMLSAQCLSRNNHHAAGVHWQAVWDRRDALATASADAWMVLMRDSLYGTGVSLLEVVSKPLIQQLCNTCPDVYPAPYRLYYDLAETLRRHGRPEGAVRAEAAAIAMQHPEFDAMHAGLEQLLLRSLDTRAAGEVLCALALRTTGTNKDRLDMVEHYLPMLRSDADTALVHRLMAEWMTPSVKYMDCDSVRYYVFTHVEEATLRLYRAELTNTYLLESPRNLHRGELVSEQRMRPAYAGRDWRVEPDTVVMTLQPAPGLYLLELVAGADTTRSALRVSTVDLLMQMDQQERVRYRVVSLADGRPLRGARLQRRWNMRDHVPEVRAYLNQQDHTSWEDNERLISLFDSYQISLRLRMRRARTQSRRPQLCGEVVADRAIYRPGHTAEIAAVLGHKRADGRNRVLPHRRVVLGITSDYKSWHYDTLRTDAEGRVTTCYTIPQSVKPGSQLHVALRYRSCEISSHYLTIDNYRRPKAKMSLSSEVRHDSCYFYATVTSANGEPIEEVDWTCRADTQTLSPEPLSPGRVRLYAGLMSQHKGSLSTHVTAVMPNGEQLEGTESLYLYRWPYTLQPAFGSPVLAGRDTSFVVYARDGNNQPVPDVPVRVTFSAPDTTMVVEGVAGQTMAMPVFPHSGSYTARAFSACDTTGTGSLPVIVPSAPVGSVDELRICFATGILSAAGEDVYILSPYPDVLLRLYVVDEYEHQAEHTVLCHGNLATFHLDYDAAMGKRVRLYVVAVYHGDLAEEQASLSVQPVGNTLRLGLRSFRRLTRPGAEEEWTLTVTNPQGKPVPGAAVIATMYDATLDQLASLPRWYIYTDVSTPYFNYRDWDLVSGRWTMPTLRPKWVIPAGQTPRLEWLGYAPNRRTDIVYAMASEVAGVPGQPGTNASVMLRGAAASNRLYGLRSCDVVMEEELELSEVVTCGYGAPMAKGAATPSPACDPSAWVRSDFRERALWSARGVTNLRGELPMHVTLPDQLSTWHLRVLAYDKSLHQGTLDTTMLVEQALTLQPLWPRFVRVGDRVAVLAEARNRSDEALSLTGIVEVRSADSAQVLYRSEEALTLQPGETRQLMAPLPVTSAWGDSVLVAWTIGNTQVGDGEQQWVAVHPAVSVLPVDTTIRRSPEEVLREQLNRIRPGDADDALRVALALYMAHQEGRHDLRAEARLRRVVNKDGGIAWCPGMGSGEWVTLQVLDLLLREGQHPDVVRRAMLWLDKCKVESLKSQVESYKLRTLTDVDIHYLVLSAQVERPLTDSARMVLSAMESALRTHVLGLRETRNAAHTPLTIYGVAEVGCALPDNGTPLRATAADHVLRLSLVRPEWGRYFKEQGRNSRLATQLAAIHLMDSAGRTAEADELRRWLMGQVWSRAWQNPVLIWQGLEQVAGDRLQATGYRQGEFDSHGLVTMRCEWSGADSLRVGGTCSVRVQLESETELDLVRVTIPLPACMEPARALSGYRYLGGQWVYVAQYDDRVELCFQRLGVGDWDFTLDMRVLRPGTCSAPESVLQSDYWPEVWCADKARTLQVIPKKCR